MAAVTLFYILLADQVRTWKWGQGMLLDTDGNLYISLARGGADSDGSIVRYTISSSELSLRYSFPGGTSGGSTPTSLLSRDSSGNLYVTTYDGGANNAGTFEKITPGGTATLLQSFPTGTSLTSAPAVAASGVFYTPVISGDIANDGYIIKLTTGSNSTQTTLFDFANGFHDGAHPEDGQLLTGPDGHLHGLTLESAQSASVGTAFNITTNETYIQDATSLPDNPYGQMAYLDGTYYLSTYSGGYYDSGNFIALDSKADDGYDVLSVFGQEAGEEPTGLLLASDGYLYGSAEEGGAMGDGCIFRMDQYGQEEILASFDGTNGNEANTTLTQGSDGTFYGTTYEGGTSNAGTIFSFTPEGGIKTLASLASSAGDNPAGVPVLDSDGYLYSTTKHGGAHGQGAIIKIKATGGALSTIYSFDSQTGGADGENPYSGLIVGTDHHLYGTTISGGSDDNGVVFAVTTGGSFHVVHTFNASGADGYTPLTTVVEASDGNIYGMTEYGGVQPYPGTDVDGSVYKIATLLPIVNSISPTRGTAATSVVLTGVNFTGATEVTFDGVSATFTVNSSTQITAAVPSGNTAGSIIVTTPNGSAYPSTKFNVPTISSFTPTSGVAGTKVTITGTALTNAATVEFNGISAAFTVNSDTSITATVPSGSATGKISVSDSGGTATNSSTFTVTAPSISSFTPTSGVAGAMVTITGSAFTGASGVAFNGISAAYTVSSGTSISATVPSGNATGKITVATSGGTATSSGTFTVAAPTIASFTPTTAAPGATITVTGTNFTGATAVTIDGTSATFTVKSSTSLTVTIPTAAKSGKIAVTTPGGTAISSSSLTVS